jgi:hypothetical protein
MHIPAADFVIMTLVPRQLAGVAPATTAPGNAAGRRARQAAAAALASAADELNRFPLLPGNRDRGLRGGTVMFSTGPGLRPPCMVCAGSAMPGPTAPRGGIRPRAG